MLCSLPRLYYILVSKNVLSKKPILKSVPIQTNHGVPQLTTCLSITLSNSSMDIIKSATNLKLWKLPRYIRILSFIKWKQFNKFTFSYKDITWNSANIKFKATQRLCTIKTTAQLLILPEHYKILPDETSTFLDLKSFFTFHHLFFYSYYSYDISFLTSLLTALLT